MIRRQAIFLLQFLFGRGSLFVAPIVLSNYLPASTYGAIEYAQAFGALAAIVLSLGAASVIPLSLTGRIAADFFNAATTVCFSGSVVLIMLSLTVAFGSGNYGYGLPLLLAGHYINQNYWSARLKSSERGGKAVLLEASFWVVTATFALAANALMLSDNLFPKYAFTAISLYCIAALVTPYFVIWKAADGTSNLIANPIAAIRSIAPKGLPLAAAGLLAVFATSSGRIILGSISDYSSVAIYSSLFRVTAIPIIAHQIIAIYSFKQFFTLPSQQLDERMTSILLSVFISAGLFFASIGWSGQFFGEFFSQNFITYRPAALLVLAQSILWSAIALNDMANNREQQAGRVAAWCIAYFIVAVPLVLLATSSHRIFDLTFFVQIHTLFMLGYYLTQVFTMHSLGIRLVRTWSTALACFICLIAVGSFG